MISAFNKLVSNAITPLVQTLQSILVPMFTGSLNSVFNSASSVVRNIISIFRSLIDFIKNVFTGNWRGAWNNVRSIFSNAVSGLAVIFKAPLNAIVDGWNSLARSLGSVSVPDWVPEVGGKSFSLPKMSRLKIGMDYVPCDMYPAYLDEGEWVLTKEEANILRSYGGLEGMIGMIDRNSSNVNGTQGMNRNDIIVRRYRKDESSEIESTEYAARLSVYVNGKESCSGITSSTSYVPVFDSNIITLPEGENTIEIRLSAQANTATAYIGRYHKLGFIVAEL